MKSLKVKNVETKETKAKKVMSANEDSALKEFLKKQKSYKELFLARLYKGAEMKEMREQLQSGDIKMQWYGMTFPKSLLAIEHDIVQNTYYDLLMKEENLKQSLKQDGLTKQDLIDLLKKNVLKKTFKKNVSPSYLG